MYAAAGGGLTVNVADWVVLPPAPVQSSVYVTVPVVEGITDSLPLVGSEPDQLPLAVQDVALVDDHVSVELAPSVIDVGLKEMLTVGAGGVLTVRVAALLPVPPAPVQLKV
jgi:hypothetical protein